MLSKMNSKEAEGGDNHSARNSITSSEISPSQTTNGLGEITGGPQESETVSEDELKENLVATAISNGADTLVTPTDAVTGQDSVQHIQVCPPIRPSWIKKSQREALQKAKHAIDADFDLPSRTTTSKPVPEEPEKKQRMEVHIEAQQKAMQDLKDKIGDSYGEDGWFSYKMLGECYIHGMMDGEAMLLQNEGDSEHPGPIPSVVFEIR